MPRRGCGVAGGFVPLCAPPLDAHAVLSSVRLYVRLPGVPARNDVAPRSWPDVPAPSAKPLFGFPA